MKYEITCFASDEVTNKVLAIKGLRGLTGFGLKEAKAIIDQIIDGGTIDGNAVVVDGCIPDSQDARDGIVAIEGAGGFKVELLDVYKQLRLLLQEAAKLSIDLDRLHATRDIIQVIDDLQH